MGEKAVIQALGHKAPIPRHGRADEIAGMVAYPPASTQGKNAPMITKLGAAKGQWRYEQCGRG